MRETSHARAPTAAEAALVVSHEIARLVAAQTAAGRRCVLGLVTGTTLIAVETCDYRGHRSTDEIVHRMRFVPENLLSVVGIIAYEVYSFLKRTRINLD